MTAYIHTETLEYPLFEGDIRLAFRHSVSFPVEGFEPPAGYAAVQPSPQPEADAEHIVTEATPALIDGVWTQQWTVADAPPELVAQRRAALVPPVIDMAQARLELLAAGLLDDVGPAIEALPEPQRSAARIEWEYRTQVHRASTLVATLGAALGLSSEQIDALFINAARR